MGKNYWIWPALMALTGCVAEDPEGRESSVGTAIEAVRVCADGPTVDGVDVSHWETVTDWNAVRGSGVLFAYTKATQGDDFVDPLFDTYWSGMRDAGILRGAFHFFCPNLDGTAQADLFLSTVGTLEADDLPPVLDVEGVPPSICPPCCSDGVACSAMVPRIRAWIDRVEAATGRSPMIYTGRGFWEGSVCNAADFNSYPLWVANWDVTCPDMPSAWADWAFWQTSDSGTVPGIAEGVDLDVFNGDAAALDDFIGSGPSCGDDRCSGAETCITCPGDCGPCPPDPDEDGGTDADAPADLPADDPADLPAEAVEDTAADMNDGVEAGPDADARVDVQGEDGADLPSDHDAGTGLDSDTGCSCSMTT